MERDHELETARTDADGFIGSLASRLRLHAQALRGMAADESDSDSVEARLKFEMAADLGVMAGTLDLLRDHLCSRCRLVEVLQRTTVGDEIEEGDK